MLHERSARFVVALAAAALSLEAAAAGADSVYLRLPSDTAVSGTQVLLTTTIEVSPAGTDVLLEADGRYAPTAPGLADVFITVDSAKVSNDGAIDWSSSTDARQHSFDVVGAARLGSGSHTISLVGVAFSGAFTVGADSSARRAHCSFNRFRVTRDRTTSRRRESPPAHRPRTLRYFRARSMLEEPQLSAWLLGALATPEGTATPCWASTLMERTGETTSPCGP